MITAKTKQMFSGKNIYAQASKQMISSKNIYVQAPKQMFSGKNIHAQAPKQMVWCLQEFPQGQKCAVTLV